MKDSDMLAVCTLGRFDVIKNGSSLIVNSAGSKKIWELFKFMLTHRDRSFTPESLMDQLWVLEEYSDPRTTLRKQMHRLRKTLGEDLSEESENTILFTNGYYRWNDQVSIELDAETFENYVKEGDARKEESPEEALQYYKSALDLYVGDYLPECTNQYWVYSARNHYRRLYLKTVMNMTELLKAREAFDEILELCQRAIQVDVYEEVFHINLLEAFMVKGEFRQAFEHYEYITGFYDREMGIKPSDEMRAIYKRLLASQYRTKVESNFCDVLEKDVCYDNAFYCEPEVFKSIYELERRRSQRQNTCFSVAVITVNPIEGYTYSQNELRMNKIKQILLRNLRKGDTVTCWNYRQFAVLLPGVDGCLMERILRRILDHDKDNVSIMINQVDKLPSMEIKNELKTIKY